MNKQALAFISMFTLVLMLSIYYVSLDLPVETPNVSGNDVATVIALLNEQNEEAKEEEVLSLKQQLGDSQTSEEKKKEILALIETIESSKSKEAKIVKALSEKSIKSVVSIKTNIVSVNVYEVDKSTEKADEIMRMIYPLIDKNQTIELVFS